MACLQRARRSNGQLPPAKKHSSVLATNKEDDYDNDIPTTTLSFDDETTITVPTFNQMELLNRNRHDESRGGSIEWVYGTLKYAPDTVLGNHETGSVALPTRSQVSEAYYELLDLQNPSHRRLRNGAKLFDENYNLFAIQSNYSTETDDATENRKAFSLATQVRLSTWLSKAQRSLFLAAYKGDLWNAADNKIEIPGASGHEQGVIWHCTVLGDPIDSGGCKRIYLADSNHVLWEYGAGIVLLEYAGDNEDAIKMDLAVSQLASALSTVCPNYPKLSSTPFCVTDDCFDGPVTNNYYALMPKLSINLRDYSRRFENASCPESSKTMVLMGVGVQICCGVLAGQSLLGLLFRDLKMGNVMLDGDQTHKYYPMSLGSSVFVFESVTEEGCGTVKIIDHSTTTVVAPTSDISECVRPFCEEVSSSHLTPLEVYLLDHYVRGFHRDVHNIMLVLIKMFAYGASCQAMSIAVPKGFELKMAWDIFPRFANDCYRHLVLLSTMNTSIIDTLSTDPTFAKSSKFQEFKAANKKLLKSKDFAKDVAMFSLLDGSEFVGLRDRLGYDKVELLWKGMAPNPALRPTLPIFMLAFFKDYMIEVEAPKDELRKWYDAHRGEETEIMPLLLNEDHAEMMLGSEKDSFVLKSGE